MKLVLLRTLSLFESVIFISVFAYLTYILKRGLYENVKKNFKEEFNSFKYIFFNLQFLLFSVYL